MCASISNVGTKRPRRRLEFDRARSPRSVAPSSLLLLLLLPLLPLRLPLAARLRGRHAPATQERLRRGNLRATRLLLLGLELAYESSPLLPRKRREDAARARTVVARLPAGERAPRGRSRAPVVLFFFASSFPTDANASSPYASSPSKSCWFAADGSTPPRVGERPETCAPRVSWNLRDDASASRARMSASGSSIFARNASFGLCARIGHSRSPLACPKPPQRRHCVARIRTPRGRAPTPSASPPPRGARRGAPASSGNASAAATFLPSASLRILRFLRRAISSSESGGRPAATRAAVSSAARAVSASRAAASAFSVLSFSSAASNPGGFWYMNASSRLYLADARSFAASASVFLKNSAFAANSRAASASRRARAAAACSAWNTFSRFLYESGCHDLRCRYWWDHPEPPAPEPEVARAAPARASGSPAWACVAGKGRGEASRRGGCRVSRRRERGKDFRSAPRALHAVHDVPGARWIPTAQRLRQFVPV